MPGSFIPMIEEMDVMACLGEWALGEAARQAGEWEKQGIQLKVGVNIATTHFGSDGFVPRAKQIIAESPVDASRIQLEITEETMLGSLEGTKQIIATLQDEGFEISLDDYGRGYSNLTRLANLTVNSVKIDGPLTRCLTTDQRTKVIVASTIDMAHGLGCLTVAEGVETLEQAQMLRSLGCDILQGYYFARPMPACDLARWMERRGRNEVHEAQRSLSLFVGNTASSPG